MDQNEYAILLQTGLPLMLKTDDVVVMAEFVIDTVNPGAQNNTFHTESSPIIDWSENNPFAELSL